MNNPYESSTVALRQPGTSPASTWLMALGVVLSALPAITCWLVLGQFQQVFAGFGVELPALTKLVLGYHQLLWLVPAGIAALIFWSRPAERAKRAMIFGLASALIVLPVCVAAMYIPVFKLGAVVG